MGANRNLGGTFLNVALFVFGAGLLVLGYAFFTGSILPQSSSVSESTEESAVSEEGFDRIIQVEVRNGVGAGGLARRTTQYLREHGYDVVEAGNYRSFDVEHTAVIDRGGDRDAADRLARTLGIAEEHVREDIRADLYLDVSVIIGHDYQSLDPFKNQ